MKHRERHRVRAALGGYFWLPCPLCGQFFGGHEWHDIDGKISSIPTPHSATLNSAICPDCTRAGRGYERAT